MTTSEALATFAGRFGASVHRPTFGRSLRSELMKLNTRAIKITILIGITLQALLTLIIANSEYWDRPDYAMITISAQNSRLFAAIIGVLAVTAEYSHNTMRTTALADPRRSRAYLAKVGAVAIVVVAYAVIAVALGWLVATFKRNNFDAFTAGVTPYAGTVGSILAIGLLACGFGYILRSTAGSIALVVGLVYMIDLLTLIPQKFFRETFAQLTPSSLRSKATLNDFAIARPNPLFESSWTALAILFGYALAVLLIGWLAYRKRDI